MGLLGPVHGQAVATARRLCRSAAEGDDLDHESLLLAFDRLHTLRDVSRFRSWFYAILLNRHRNRYRASFWRRFLPWEAAFPDGREPEGERGEEWGERSRQANRVAQALAALAPEQREAVVLFEIDGYSIGEIAAMQGVGLPAVKSRLTRGRAALRRQYERLDTRIPAVEPSRVGELTPLRVASVPIKEGSDD